MIKTIIFDLDGTILDTLEDLTDSINYALKKYNKQTKTENEIRSFLGDGMRMLVERSLPNENEEVVSEVFNEFKDYYLKHCDIKTKTYPGIVELLNSLKNDYKLGVISNKRDDAVQALIKNHFPNIFSFVLGQKDEMKKKPNKEMLEYALANLDCKSYEALYVGDSDVDLDFGFNAKVSVISVSYGFRSHDFLVEKGARYIANDVQNLKRFIAMLSESHCPGCGAKLTFKYLSGEGNIPYCNNCHTFRFPSFSSAVSMIIVNKDETKVLLIEQYHSTRNILVAGYVNIGESLENAVKREIKEEVGLDVVFLRFNKSEFHSRSNTLMNNFIAVVSDENIKIKEDEVDKAFFVNKNEAIKKIAPNSLAKRFLENYLK